MKIRKMKCQLCEKDYPRAGSKFTLCPECATEITIREARILWSNLSIARTYELPATLTLRQWLATLDYFAWKCAYCQERPHKIMEHVIPISMSDNYPRYDNAAVGGTTLKNCISACYDCNGKKKSNCPDYIWEISSGVEQGMFPTLGMIERIAQYLQIDLNNLPMSLYTGLPANCIKSKEVTYNQSYVSRALKKQPLMTRPTGVFKHAPGMTNELNERYARISKADWADLYFDLFRQMNGETTSDEAIMQDAEKRLDILKAYRKA